jgi:hypothetical protein
VDERDACTDENKNDGLICLDEEKTICISWRNILIAVFMCNVIQVIFESAMLYASETTLRPTYLDKLQNPDSIGED